MILLISTALVSADQVSPIALDGDRWAWRRTTHTISDTLTCEPNGTFSISLRWRFRHGVEHATIRHGKDSFPAIETEKLTSALRYATDFTYVRLDCIGRRDATVTIAYTDVRPSGPSARKLLVHIFPGRIELSPSSE